ncbi:type I-C CRISPR-associated protein Cas8c/Csd1 [Clostridia bacterium]|nr:type I-C CRISPR-associated protein Cas8c/Csd1 [Clostridia bacterium]
MILQSLCTYYKRLEDDPDSGVAPPGYAYNNVGACITLDEDGNVTNVLSLMKEKKQFSKLLTPIQPKRSGSSPEAAFLCENKEFIFGIYKDDKGAQYRFNASREKHERVLKDVDDAGARALFAFFDKRHQGSSEYEGIDTSPLEVGSNIVFRLKEETTYLHERPKICEAWDKYVNSDVQSLPVAQCLVSGEIAPIARLHGNLGGFGTDRPTVVGFNQTAFCSYGRKKQEGENAPVSHRAAFEYVTALNSLIADRRHVVRIAGDRVLFWAEESAGDEEDFLALMFGNEPTDVSEEAKAAIDRKLLGALQAIRKGKMPAEYDFHENVVFSLLGIAANKTRVVIRFFYRSSFGQLLRQIAQHYQDINITGGESDTRIISPFRILLETAVQHKAENIPPQLQGGLMRSILWGTSYSHGLYMALLNRTRAEHEVNRVRAGMIKGYLNRLDRSQNRKEGLTVGLNLNETNTGYLLGRLLALMEYSQKEALGDVNATIVDKYLNAALATPQNVFSVLLPLFEKHVSKSERYFRKSQAQEIIGLIGSDGFPKTLNSEDQGRFLVGYYHQRQVFYTKRAASDNQTIKENETLQEVDQ